MIDTYNHNWRYVESSVVTFSVHRDPKVTLRKGKTLKRTGGRDEMPFPERRSFLNLDFLRGLVETQHKILFNGRSW